MNEKLFFFTPWRLCATGDTANNIYWYIRWAVELIGK